MSLPGFITSKVFVRLLLKALGISAILIILVLLSLSIYTRHGSTYVVSDFRGLQYKELMKLSSARNFEFIILDSIYDDKYPKGSIIMQDPFPGSKIKRNRKIYLTTVAVMSEKVQVPDLVDLTLRQAAATLETYGLKLGRLDYVPDIARNAVLRLLHQGAPVAPGTILDRGAVIDLVLGKGLSGDKIQVPLLAGMTLAEVRSLLVSLSLNLGTTHFIRPADSLASRVYRQDPAWSPSSYINIGQAVDIWLRPSGEFDFDSLRRSITKDYSNYTDTLFLN